MNFYICLNDLYLVWANNIFYIAMTTNTVIILLYYYFNSTPLCFAFSLKQTKYYNFKKILLLNTVNAKNICMLKGM